MCDRCGSDVHPANVRLLPFSFRVLCFALECSFFFFFSSSQNCPTLWRIYLYLTPPSREEVLTERQRLKELGGFEGDVLEADPETEWGDGDGGWGGWCYNCSTEGHWGDVSSFFFSQPLCGGQLADLSSLLSFPSGLPRTSNHPLQPPRLLCLLLLQRPQLSFLLPILRRLPVRHELVHRSTSSVASSFPSFERRTRHSDEGPRRS